MSKAIALLASTLALQGCSYSYPIWATMVGGRLAFESGDPAYGCFTNISVAMAGPLAPDPARDSIADPVERGRAEAAARDVWRTDAVATYECKGKFPVVYGAPMPEITIVAARPLKIGVPYAVSTYGPKGAGGHGCFKINPDRRPENISDHLCNFDSAPPPEPSGPAEPVAPPEPPTRSETPIGPAAAPAAAAPRSNRQLHQVPGIPGGMASNSVSPPPAISVHSGIAPAPIDARPPADRTGPAQMYALTPYRGIERWLREYPSLAACEEARSRMAAAEADRRLCGLGPKRPR
jgi:hypothetical protein